MNATHCTYHISTNSLSLYKSSLHCPLYMPNKWTNPTARFLPPTDGHITSRTPDHPNPHMPPQFNDRQHHILSFINFLFHIAHISTRFYLYGTVMPDIILCYMLSDCIVCVCVPGNRLSVPQGTLIYIGNPFMRYMYFQFYTIDMDDVVVYVRSDGLNWKLHCAAAWVGGVSRCLDGLLAEWQSADGVLYFI